MSKARLLADISIDKNGAVPASALSELTLDSAIRLKNDSTGYLAVPSGTDAQLPANAKNGVIRFNTGNNLIEFYLSSKWQFVTVEKLVFLQTNTVTKSVNPNPDVVMYFFGVADSSVSLVFSIVGNPTLNINVVNNKSVFKLPAAVLNSTVNQTIKIESTSGTDKLNDTYLTIQA